MWYILWKAVITVLVIYSVVDIIGKLFLSIFAPEPYNRKDIFLVVRVKNQQNNLEGIIRNLIWQNLKISKGGNIPNILIVDSGSDDDTPIIANKLCDCYSFIFYTTEEQFEKMKEDFQKIK